MGGRECPRSKRRRHCKSWTNGHAPEGEALQVAAAFDSARENASPLAMNLRAPLLLGLTMGLTLPLAAQVARTDGTTGDLWFVVLVNDLFARMMLEEKVGQLMQYSSDDHPTGPATKDDVLGKIQAGLCGSMLN